MIRRDRELPKMGGLPLIRDESSFVGSSVAFNQLLNSPQRSTPSCATPVTWVWRFMKQAELGRWSSLADLYHLEASLPHVRLYHTVREKQDFNEPLTFRV